MPVDLEELTRLLKAATPGPWRPGSVERDAVFIPHHEGLAGPGGERVLLRMNKNYPHETDAALICAAVNALQELIEKARRCGELEGALREIAAYPKCRMDLHAPTTGPADTGYRMMGVEDGHRCSAAVARAALSRRGGGGEER